MIKLRHLIIVIALMPVIIVSAMNGVLFITHPELTYGTPGMYHIAVIFMLVAIGLVYLLSRIELKYIESQSNDKNVWSFIFSHQTILVNVVTQFVLYLILAGLDVFTDIKAVLIPFIILLITFLWIRTTKMLYLRTDRYLPSIYIHFFTYLIFIGYTAYLTIKLFLFMNIN
ncbi:MAG: hypothetical protein NUK62_04260 [Tenericutes bacterium]|nr:hypothetical protein [Mycoplasmatota bacterium]